MTEKILRRVFRFTVTVAILALPTLASAQTGTVAPYPILQFFDSNGDPLNGGKLCTYEAGTSTPLATYSDTDLTVANPNPVVLNSAGRPAVSGNVVAVYLQPQSYKFVLRTAGSDGTCSTGTVLWTADNVAATPPSNVDLDIQGTAGETLATGDVVYLSDGSSGIAGRWYLADADNTYSSINAIAIGLAAADITTGNTGSIRLQGRMTGLSALSAGSTFYISASAGDLTSSAPANARVVGVADSSSTLVITRGNTITVPSQQTGDLYQVSSTTGSPARLPTFRSICNGRLTLTSGTPVTTGDVTGATTIYFTPYQGGHCALYNGTSWQQYTFSELSIAVPASTNQMYDVFLLLSGGTPTLTVVAWTNDTTRTTGITLQDGVYVQSGSTGRRYLGSFRTTGVSGQTEDSQAKRFVWNYYHRVDRTLFVSDTTASWTYNTQAWRQVRATATNQVEVVVGVAEVAIDLRATGAASGGVGAGGVGIGQNSTSALATGTVVHSAGPSTSESTGFSAYLRTYPAVGYSYFAWLEYGRTNSPSDTVFVGGSTFPKGLSGRIAG